MNKKWTEKAIRGKALKSALKLLTLALSLQTAQAATIEVTTSLDDDGLGCTLREAIATVNAGSDQTNDCVINTGTDALGSNDVITFDSAVTGSTITLSGTQLLISKNVTINGGNNTTIDASNASFQRALQVSDFLSDVTLDQLTFSGGGGSNTFIDDGGISVGSSSTVNLINSMVSGNSGGSGGGIFVGSSSTVNLINSTVSGNNAGDFGGGIFAARFSTVTLINSTVSGNSSGNFGGAGIFARPFSTVTLTNSTVSGNDGSSGSGITAVEATVTLTNSTISGNTAGGVAGGIYAVTDSTVTLTNSTVSDNSTGFEGGGIYVGSNDPSDFSNLTLVNSIVSGNSATMGVDCFKLSGTIFAESDSIIEDDSCGTAAMTADPVLGPLADNGGPTMTHALLLGSPAIDAGIGAGATLSDQRGFAAVGVRDIGAYEFGAVDPNADADGDGVLDVSDNCPLDSNADQADNDIDLIGDVCDNDDDNDGVLDGPDNCPFTDNPDQIDSDTDGLGDACDADPDGDGVETGDNCPFTPNTDQTDTDNDSMGDACDVDDDNDTVDDVNDNCPLMVNADQADLDGDNIGDICDGDIEGDDIDNDVDNCPLIANPAQDDTDLDTQGDACDDDDDNDGICDGAASGNSCTPGPDNCPLITNLDQTDSDNDGLGDACGDVFNDDDGDGVIDDIDNCPMIPNADQNDTDSDGIGDACDDDIDGDGVDNGGDMCAGSTPLDTTVNSDGCSITQLVPCEGPRGTTQSWKNHGKYVSGVAKTAKSFVLQGLITESEKGVLVSSAGQSQCGE